VAITDTGIGIKGEDQARVFNEFEQVDSSYGRRQQGSGLGLALTKKLVEMHGGRVWVESEGVAGKGSVFTFLIPMIKAESEPAPPVASLHLQDIKVFPSRDGSVRTGASL
jgi:signal transduction histidine kinase